MYPCLCDYCDAKAIGELFHRNGPRICRVCRDRVLTFLARMGIAMADTHPFVRELCVDSHIIQLAHYNYYNSDTQALGVVLRIQKRPKESP